MPDSGQETAHEFKIQHMTKLIEQLRAENTELKMESARYKTFWIAEYRLRFLAEAGHNDRYGSISQPDWRTSSPDWQYGEAELEKVREIEESGEWWDDDLRQ